MGPPMDRGAPRTVHVLSVGRGSTGFYRQRHGCAMGSPVSPIVANLYMDEVESRALITFTGSVPSHWSMWTMPGSKSE